MHITAVWRYGGCSASYDSYVVGSSAVLRWNFFAKNRRYAKPQTVSSNFSDTLQAGNSYAENFDITRQAVSKHLRILTECELVKQEPRGREIYYQLEIKKMKDIDHYLEKIRSIWEGRYNHLDKLLNQLKTNI